MWGTEALKWSERPSWRHVSRRHRVGAAREAAAYGLVPAARHNNKSCCLSVASERV
jgi:hypothetical protein